MSGLADGADPFAALGLPPRADLTDDDVRAAWRRIATATHPDRADGGDPGRFAVAAAAYTVLRTRSGRGEALADLASPSPVPGRARPPAPAPAAGRRGPAGHSIPAAGGHGPAAGGHGPARRNSMVRRRRTVGRPVSRGRSGADRHSDAARRSSRDLAGAPWRGPVAVPDPPGPAARLALRVLIAAALSAVAVAVAGSQPATPALITGALTWLLLTARHDLAPPPNHRPLSPSR